MVAARCGAWRGGGVAQEDVKATATCATVRGGKNDQYAAFLFRPSLTAGVLREVARRGAKSAGSKLPAARAAGLFRSGFFLARRFFLRRQEDDLAVERKHRNVGVEAFGVGVLPRNPDAGPELADVGLANAVGDEVGFLTVGC